MAPRLPWSKLIPGLIALTALVAIALIVMLYSGVGRIRGETIRLYVATDQARGIMKGTDVWLAGQRVGTVVDISFAPPLSDTARRVIIAVDVRKRDAAQIRRDSEVQVRTGTNIVGPFVVYVTPGTSGSPAVANGDTLRAGAQTDLEVATAKLAPALVELEPLAADARAIAAQARSPSGTIGAALASHGRNDDALGIQRLRAGVARLRAQTGGSGAKAGGVITLARGALARADSIRALLRSDQSALGRFRRDSTLAVAVADVRDELARLRDHMRENDGALGRFESDSAITHAVAEARLEMTRLYDDIRRRPLRYIAF